MIDCKIRLGYAITDGDFRFVTIFTNVDSLYSTEKYTFLLHKPVVLIKEHHERHYEILDNGSLLMYEHDKSYTFGNKSIKIDGTLWPKDHPMVIELNKFLLEEVINKEVLGAKD